MNGHPSPTFAVVTGGGTTGHVNPALAILELLTEAGHDPRTLHYVGSDRGVESTLVAGGPYPATLLRVRGLRRSLTPKGIRDNLAMVPTMVRAIGRARRLLAELRPSVVVSVGGYASIPACRAARRLGIPVVTCSYDRIPGLATRLQSNYAAACAVAHGDSRLPRATLTGAPVRASIRRLDRSARRSGARESFGVRGDAFVIGVIGGSLGSGVLNAATSELVGRLRPDEHVIHLCGERYASDGVAGVQSNYTRIAYTDAIEEVYAACDLVVTRAGASTIAEVAVTGTPCVVVPWAGAAEDHQTHNAKWLGDAGAAMVVPEEIFSGSRIRAIIDELRADPARMDSMGVRARALGAIHDGTLLTRTIERVASTSLVVDLSVPTRVHVVGVGGPGMSALARALVEAGHGVSGSDLVESETLAGLRDCGVTVHVGHDARHVEGVGLVTYSTAIPATNVELVSARQSGSRVVTRAAVLAALCAQRRSVGVAGTHGKTTTSGMLATILRAAELDPGFVIGADVRSLGAAARWGTGEIFVVEADESDSTHVALPLSCVLVTNVDVDHLDHFTTIENLEDSFDYMIHNTRGVRVVCGDDARLSRIARAHDVVTYGLGEDVDVRGTNVRYEHGGSTTTVCDGRSGRVLGELTLRLRGEHNVLNALGAITMARALGVGVEASCAALATFRGVERRFDLRGTSGGASFVDDYAHLPAEIATVLRGARDSSDAWRRVVAVFQPNRYNRMNTMSPEYRDAFVGADLVVVTEIYPSGTRPIPGVTGKLVVDAIRAAHPNQRVEWIERREDLVNFLAAELGEGDLCISMGCGDVESLPDEVIAARERP